MRVLLTANFVYAFVLPVIDIFVAAYIMRNSNDVRMVMSYQMALFSGIPLTFYLNGYLLRRVPIKLLYSVGMLLSGISMAVMVSLTKLESVGIVCTGFLMGIAVGLFWANRDFLALSSTTDTNRNYYYGLETFFSTLCGLIVPISVGWLVGSADAHGWFGGNRNHAYLAVSGVLVLFSIGSSTLICSGSFVNPPPTRFVYWTYHHLWREILCMAVFRGMAQGFMATVPAMLVMLLLNGKEGELGLLQTLGSILTAIVLYLVGRLAKPKDRFVVLGIGLTLYVSGAITNSMLFSPTGAIVFIVCQMLGRPLMDNAFFPIQMQAIDLLSFSEGRNSYTYIFNHEFALFVGRMAGGLLFIGIATYLTQLVALRYTMVAVGALQFMTLLFAQRALVLCRGMHAD